MNGADPLCDTLLANGVDVCFANPGTSEMHFVAALDRKPRDALRARPVRGRGHRRGRRLRAHGRQAGRDAAAPRARASPTAWPTCTTRGAPARRSSTSSATTPPITSRYDAPLTTDIEALARPMSHWVQPRRDGRRRVGARRRGRRSARATAAGPHRDADPAGRRRLGRDRTAPLRRRGRAAARAASGADRDARRGAGAAQRPPHACCCWPATALRERGARRWRPHRRRPPARGCWRSSPNARIERGAGRVADRPRALRGRPGAGGASPTSTHVILVGAKAPVAFFAYPGQAEQHAAAGLRGDRDWPRPSDDLGAALAGAGRRARHRPRRCRRARRRGRRRRCRAARSTPEAIAQRAGRADAGGRDRLRRIGHVGPQLFQPTYGARAARLPAADRRRDRHRHAAGDRRGRRLPGPQGRLRCRPTAAACTRCRRCGRRRASGSTW